MRLRANEFGAATSRERVFFVGYNPAHFSKIEVADFAGNANAGTSVSFALSGLPRIFSHWIKENDGIRALRHRPNGDFFCKIASCIPPDVGDPDAIAMYETKRLVSGCLGTRHSEELARRYGQLKPGEQDPITKSVRLRKNGLCPTLRAGTGADKGSFQAVRPIHPSAPRVITPREAARLQGFPDWFQFAPSKWHSFRQIGNSVSPFVAEAVLAVLRKKLGTLPHEKEKGSR
jgi:DNA (cytosine-5)-methyltransferase 1